MNELLEYNVGDLSFFSSPLLDSLGFVVHAYGTRDSYPLNDRKELFEKDNQNFSLLNMLFKSEKLGSSLIDVYRNCFVGLKQVHSSKVISTEEMRNSSSNIADAVVTNESGLILSIETADCLPVFIVDKVLKAVAAIHAGRQGILKGIIKETVNKLKSEYGSKPSNLIVAIGPGICGNSYEVGYECIVPFNQSIPESEDAFIQKGNGKWILDLPKIVIKQLLVLGVSKEKIGSPGPCTFVNSKIFFSYRREGKGVGRQTSSILLV